MMPAAWPAKTWLKFIAADVGGQATLLKKPLKHRESVFFPGRRKGFTGAQKPPGVVGDRQRIAVLVIAQ